MAPYSVPHRLKRTEPQASWVMPLFRRSPRSTPILPRPLALSLPTDYRRHRIASNIINSWTNYPARAVADTNRPILVSGEFMLRINVMTRALRHSLYTRRAKDHNP